MDHGPWSSYDPILYLSKNYIALIIIVKLTTNRWNHLNNEFKINSLETLKHEQWQSSSEWTLKNYIYHLDSLSSLLSYNETFSTFTLELSMERNKGMDLDIRLYDICDI